jgi:capsid protein
MTRFANFAVATFLAANSAFFAGGKAEAADLTGIYADDTGICGEAWVLRTITSRFRHQVKNVPHLPDVAITDFHRIHQHRYLPAQEEWPIGRRYCGATVALSDGDSRDIWYLIEEGQGYASIGDNVEFCVSGFDRWMVYNGRCRVLR